MATLKLYLDTRFAKNDGTHALKVTLTHRGKSLHIPLGLSIRRDQWDKSKCRIINCPQKAALNTFLQTRLAQMNAALLSISSEAGRLSVSQVREKISPKQDDDRVTFKKCFDAFVAQHENNGTKTIYQSTWRKISLYDSNAEKLCFEDMNREWLESFYIWLADASPSINARNIHLRNIRAVFNYAIDEELTNFYPFRKLKIRPARTMKRNLPLEELRHIMTDSFSDVLQKYVDVFRLSFFLIGINIGDLLELMPQNDNSGRIEYNRKKTHRFYSVRLEPEAAAIIKKYEGGIHLINVADNCTSYRNFAMKLNPMLQRIMPNVTSYWARHSWATIAASLDIPKETIAAALGHGGNTVTDIYIDFDRRKVDEANRRVIDWVLYGKR